jgi:WD40-like Beta Propeller Repeat
MNTPCFPWSAPAALMLALLAVAVLAAADQPDSSSRDVQRRIFFRYDGVDGNFGRLAFTGTDRPEHIEFAGDLRCEVIYATAERGICLTVEQRILGLYSAVLFDTTTFKVVAKIPTQGLPSRVRISVDGRFAAFTVFTSGHGYVATNFATRTTLIDMPRAAVLADLESFSVTKDGAPFKNKDFNFWGVSFTPDARHFYATLSTGGQRYLVYGDPVARTAALMQSNIECPSVSPDGRRIAYKKRVGASGLAVWELHSMDLASGRETSLAERRSIDDQLEWLDKDTVLYTVAGMPAGGTPATDVWRVPADGTGTPQLYLRNAASPAVIR